MKWSPENIEKLKDWCFAEVPNAEIAAEFGVDVREVHAKRSQLGITIPKVREMKRELAPVEQTEPEVSVALPEPLEQFRNGDMHCVVLAREGDTALICITNSTYTPFVVPVCHRKGTADWDNGRYFETLETAWRCFCDLTAEPL